MQNPLPEIPSISSLSVPPLMGISPNLTPNIISPGETKNLGPIPEPANHSAAASDTFLDFQNNASANFPDNSSTKNDL